MMSLDPSVAMNVGLVPDPVAGVLTEIKLPAKSQVAVAEAVCVLEQSFPQLQTVFSSTLPVGYPLVGSKPVR